MKDKTSIALWTLAALALMPLSAQARDTGFYIGGSLGQSAVEVIDDGAVNLPSGDDFTFDENDTAWKIFGGYNWKLAEMFNLGLEGGYVNFGKPNSTFTVDDIPIGLEVDLSGWNVWGTAGFALGPVDLYGKLGYVFWDAEATASSPGVPSESDSEDGNDIGYGVGGRFNLGNLGLRLEYEIYDIEDAEDVSMWSLGVEWLFN